MFDGKTNWLSGQLLQPSCAIDPDKCISGFTLATKVFLDDSVMSYVEPKYLVDTGAGSDSKLRGISMYILGGKLYCELASATKVWMVSQEMAAGTWSFIAFTWSEANGLTLYINGAKRGADASGRVGSGRTVNLSKENLAVGRDVTAGGKRFCKFMMASLLMIDSYLSPAMMRAVYSFYWRQG